MHGSAHREGPLGQLIEFPTDRIRTDPISSSLSQEQDLLQRATDGDRSALQSLYRRHASDFLSFRVRLCGSAVDAEDVAQDSFMTTFDRIHRVQPGRFRAFLYSVGVRKCQHLFRRRRLLTRLGFRCDDTDISNVARPDASPEQLAELADVLRFMARLRPEQRVTWGLRRIEGYTNEETAEMCGCSVATVKRRLRAAEVILEAKLKERGHGG